MNLPGASSSARALTLVSVATWLNSTLPTASTRPTPSRLGDIQKERERGGGREGEREGGRERERGREREGGGRERE